ncbi:berberine bridge enzyme-like 22 [Capsicum chacoense]
MERYFQFLSFLLVSFLICIETNAQQEFLDCIFNQTSDKNIEKHTHFSKSPTYSSLLEYGHKNPRWLNSSSSHPIFIIAPKNESEIRPIILCSQRFGIQIRVKSGGHDYEGLSFRSDTGQQFVIVDLSMLDDITIDENDETAWIQTGVTMGQLYYEIAKKSENLAFSGGLYPSVGSGGIISGGGIGTLMRKFGLAADNVLDARVMNVNGEILDRKSMGEDLFWAIRGGGGSSFCVILAWKVKLVRVPSKLTTFTIRRVLHGETINLLQRWQNVSHKLTLDMFMRVLIQNKRTRSKRIVQVSFQGLFLGRVSELIPLLNQTFPEFGLVEEDCFQDPVVVNCTPDDLPCIKKECFEVPWIRATLYFASRRTSDSVEFLVKNEWPRIMNYYKATSDFVRSPMPRGVWRLIRTMFRDEEKPIMILDPLGGRMDEISEFEIPFPYRKGNLFNIQYMVNWDDNRENVSSKKIKWLRELYDKMSIFVSNSSRSGYLNYRDLDFGRNDGEYNYVNSRVWGQKYFGGNFERLAKVKSKVDPSNFFKFEQSIPPFSVSR